MDVRAGFENCNGPVGVVGEYHVIARFLQFDLEDVPDQEFIFNDKDSSQLPPPSFTRRELDKSSNRWEGSIIPPTRGAEVNRGPAIAIVSDWMSVEPFPLLQDSLHLQCNRPHYPTAPQSSGGRT